MAVITHTEYKVICDNCGSDITEWMPEISGKRMAIRVARSETGLPLVRGRQYCHACEDDPEEKKKAFDPEAVAEFFKTAKLVPYDQLKETDIIKSK